MHAPTALHLDETHVADGLLAVMTLALGVTGLALAAAGGDLSRAGNWCGLVGVLTGLWAQMISRTRPERFADVVGVVLCALAIGIGAANGDLTFP